MTNTNNSIIEKAVKIASENRNLPPVDSLELALHYLNKYKDKLPEINQRLIEEEVS